MEDDVVRRRTHEIGNMGSSSTSTSSGTPGKRTLTQGATPAVTPAASLVQSQAVGHEAPETEDKEQDADKDKDTDKDKDKDKAQETALSTDTSVTQAANNQPPPPEHHQKPGAATQGQLPRLDLGKNKPSGGEAVAASATADAPEAGKVDPQTTGTGYARWSWRPGPR
jgi:hypothetical protein